MDQVNRPKRNKISKKPKPSQGRSFFIGLQEEGDRLISYSISAVASELFSQKSVQPEPKPVAPSPASPDIENVFKSFRSVMELYRKFIPLTLSFAPLLSSILETKKIGDFAKSKGIERHDLSKANKKVYELSFECYREFMVHQSDANAAREGTRHLPEVMVIGLVSCHDAFLSSLLRVVFNHHQEMVLASEKTMKFSDLLKFSTIENARNSIIDREIESVIRSSHHEHFTWMEDRFKMKLREGLTVWPNFVEICERRNLLTHTGGVISSQYLTIGHEQKYDVVGLEIGTKLTVDSAYFSRAVNIIYEISAKLCYVFWRKFSKAEQKKADNAFNELCFDLIFAGVYSLAEALLSFATSLPKSQMLELTRRMMITNYANAVRLQGRKEEAAKILNGEDWSATDLRFQVSVAAVREDIPEVLRLMKTIGTNSSPNAEDYRTWPVFRGVKTDARFASVFESIFKEPFIPATTSEILPEGQKITTSESVSPTKH